MKRLIVISCLLFAACEENPSLPPRYNGPTHADLIVDVWTTPSDWLTDDIAIKACNLWAPEGIKCEKATSGMTIDAFIVIDASPCRTNAEGAPIGTENEFSFQRITVHEDCLVPYQRRDGALLLAALGHQFGHLFGIIGHVPIACTGTKDPCGLALMNPETTALFAWMTSADDILFQSRTTAGAIGHAPPLKRGMVSALTIAPPNDINCALPLPAYAP